MKHLSKSWRSAAVAGVSLALAMLAIHLIAIPTSHAAPAAQAGPRDSDCVVDVQHRAAPRLLLLGETVDVELELRATCGVTTPLHIVLVLDASSGMVGTDTAEMKKAAKAFILRLDMQNNPETRVGVVQYEDSPRTLCQLTNDTARATSCVNKVGAHGGSAVDRAMTEGLNTMRRGRKYGNGQVINEFMVVVSGSTNPEGCDPVREVAQRVRDQGVGLITVCLGPGCDEACMLEVATSPRHAFSTSTPTELSTIFQRILPMVRDLALRQLDLVYQLEDDMQWVEGSASPAAVVAPDGRSLTFSETFVAGTGFTATLSVQPLEAGFRSIGTGSRVEFRDASNRTGSVEVRPVHVSVFQPLPARRP